MAPSSRFAASSKPCVAYLELNFFALSTKQTTLPSLAYAGIPYQVFGDWSGAPGLDDRVDSLGRWRDLDLSRRSPRARAPPPRSALFCLQLLGREPSSRLVSSAENPLDFLSFLVVLLLVVVLIVLLSSVRRPVRSGRGAAATC